MRSTSGYSKDMHASNSDDGLDHNNTLRGTHYMLAKDEDTGHIGYGRGHRIQATDGLLPDMPPDMDRLNPEQKEIMKQFPPDLDDEGGGKSGLQAAKDMAKDWKSWFKLKYLHWWIMGILVIALVALTTIYHKQIVDWLTPISKKVTTVAWGWIIPVAILFVISFPPLFGHEIVLILVGLVYGIWIGFGIAALGTLLGEIGNFYAFKHCLRSMAAGYERKNIHYACMAEMVREGGFWVMFLARLSAIPGHFTTAVFATVGMNIFIFTFAAILALPKQLLIVYLGVAIKNSGDGKEDTKSKVIKYVVLAISFIITVWTAYWLYQKMEKVRPSVSAKLRQKRYELLLQARTPGTEGYAGGDRGQRGVMHSYPPPPANGNGYGDASYGYQQNGGAVGGRFGGADDMYNGGYHNTSSTEFTPTKAYDAPPLASGGRQGYAPAPIQTQANSPLRTSHNPYVVPGEPDENRNLPASTSNAGRAPITAPMQFHRPIRTANSTSPTSPFGDPTPPHTTSSDGFPPSSRPAPARQMSANNDESAPLTNANGEWASNSSLASPVHEGDPPDYASFLQVRCRVITNSSKEVRDNIQGRYFRKEGQQRHQGWITGCNGIIF